MSASFGVRHCGRVLKKVNVMFVLWKIFLKKIQSQSSYLIRLIEKVSNSFANPVNQSVRVTKNIKAQYKHIHLTNTLQDGNI